MATVAESRKQAFAQLAQSRCKCGARWQQHYASQAIGRRRGSGATCDFYTFHCENHTLAAPRPCLGTIEIVVPLRGVPPRTKELVQDV